MQLSILIKHDNLCAELKVVDKDQEEDELGALAARTEECGGAGKACVSALHHDIHHDNHHDELHLQPQDAENPKCTCSDRPKVCDFSALWSRFR